MLLVLENRHCPIPCCLSYPPGVALDPAHSGLMLGIDHSNGMGVIRKQLSEFSCRAMLEEVGRSSKLSSTSSPRVISVLGFIQIVDPVLAGLAEVTETHR